MKNERNTKKPKIDQKKTNRKRDVGKTGVEIKTVESGNELAHSASVASRRYTVPRYLLRYAGNRRHSQKALNSDLLSATKPKLSQTKNWDHLFGELHAK